MIWASESFIAKSRVFVVLLTSPERDCRPICVADTQKKALGSRFVTRSLDCD